MRGVTIVTNELQKQTAEKVNKDAKALLDKGWYLVDVAVELADKYNLSASVSHRTITFS